MKYWSETTKSLTPYVPGEQPKDRVFIKLNTNENPYPPSPDALEAIRGELGDGLKLYPDPNGDRLRHAIAETYHIPAGRVFVGNGSDELLAFAFMAYLNPGDRLLTPDVTYSFYKVYADLFHVDLKMIPLNDDFSVPLERLAEEKGAVILANPNAPTAIALALGDVERLLQAHRDDIFILDEAYVDFGAESGIALTERYDNLLVIHTLSKSRSLAGLRVGYAVGADTLIEGLNRVKNSFNSYTLDRLALAGGAAAVLDRRYMEETRAKVVATRERTADALRGMGFAVTPSSANFLFIRHSYLSGAAIQQGLRDRGILVRRFNDPPRIEHHLRVPIGTDEEMDRFLSAVREMIGQSHV